MTAILTFNARGFATTVTENGNTLELNSLTNVTVGQNKSNPNAVLVGSPLCSTNIEIAIGGGNLIDRLVRLSVAPRETLNNAYMQITHAEQTATRQLIASLTADGTISDSTDPERLMLLLRISAMVYHNEINVNYIVGNLDKISTESYVIPFAARFYGKGIFAPHTPWDTFPLKNVFAWDDGDVAEWINEYSLSSRTPASFN